MYLGVRIYSYSFLLAIFISSYLSTCFQPIDNYLLNCGSKFNISVDNRVFVPDTRFDKVSFSSGNSMAILDPSSSSDKPGNYHAAQLFLTNSTYKFQIKENGTHLLRFHFSPFKTQTYNLFQAKFSVSAEGLLLLRNFTARGFMIKEYLMPIDKNEVRISFLPSGNSSFGFVSAIELFSAPPELLDNGGAKFVGAIDNYNSAHLSTYVMETILRVNVGGSKITPFNDTLWRSWETDEEFLVKPSAAKIVLTSQLPNYQEGGATREIAPDQVYMTAQQMNRRMKKWGKELNISWRFDVGLGSSSHLVRLHFCDIVSTLRNQLYFDIYINDFLAYKSFDLSLRTYALATPVYVDFVADSDASGKMVLAIQPSVLENISMPNAILNGVEIMRIGEKILFKNEESSKRRIWYIVASVAGGCVFILLVAFGVVLKRRKQLKPEIGESEKWTQIQVQEVSSNSRLGEGTSTSSLGHQEMKVGFSELLLATNNFDNCHIVGKGGFGVVYKGMLKDNTKVAIKRGVPGSSQRLHEFQTEIHLLSKVRHRHLVSLVGYCEEQSERILVYEYMEKGSLKSHLYGSTNTPLSWKQRLEICIGAAKGIHYLHTGSSQGIIHRDIKSTNILLDENYVAKVADFGLSRYGPSLDETHVSTNVKGSFGYLDPDYFRRQQLTDKSDVYSFGVVLFEVLCARPAVDPVLATEQVNLAEWAMQWVKEGKIEEIIDLNLSGQIKPRSLKQFGEIAEKCLADYGVDRPTMGDVLWNLEYSLQLQDSPHGDQLFLPTHSPFPSSSPSVEEKKRDSEINDITPAEATDLTSSARVFSQLLTSEGR